MVVEMTSLQGKMGGHYALRGGEPREVAEAIAEQYEAVSRTPAGLALAVPTGSTAWPGCSPPGWGRRAATTRSPCAGRRCT